MRDKPGFCPWLRMWIHPRKTIRAIVKLNPDLGLWPLSLFYGFCSLLYLAQVFSVGDRLNFYLVLFGSAVISPFWGYLSFTFSSWIAFMMGKLLRGKGQYRHIRASLAWASVPMVVNAMFWIVLVIFCRTPLFRDFPGGHLLSTNETTLFLSILFIQLILAIWTLILFLHALSEVQKYSIGMSVFNVILMSVVIGIILFLVCRGFACRCGNFFDEPILTLGTVESRKCD